MRIIFRISACLLLLTALSVFAIRLQHAGPYYLPEGGNLLAALMAVVIGLWLLRARVPDAPLPTVLNWLGLLASPLVLFFALYATLAELEEVIVLFVPDDTGQQAQLRLWVVDYEGVGWVTMPRAKADRYGLDNAEVELLRRGLSQCVHVMRYQDRERVNRTHQLRHEKYAIQRVATKIGIFGRQAGDSTVTLSLNPCPDS